MHVRMPCEKEFGVKNKKLQKLNSFIYPKSESSFIFDEEEEFLLVWVFMMVVNLNHGEYSTAEKATGLVADGHNGDGEELPFTQSTDAV
ncbi:hypothetical protein BTVI_80986 [Pitangus sulphuratus]|nr:hypothetical protein BTVI_80986 [Pitangus sulphuratus]